MLFRSPTSRSNQFTVRLDGSGAGGVAGVVNAGVVVVTPVDDELDVVVLEAQADSRIGAAIRVITPRKGRFRIG